MLHAGCNTQHMPRLHQQRHSCLDYGAVRLSHSKCTQLRPCWRPAPRSVRVGSHRPFSRTDVNACFVPQVLAALHINRTGANTMSNNGTSTSASSSSSSNRAAPTFYNRTFELDQLAAHCSNQPSSISVILGPRSAGKTALSEEYMRSRGHACSKCFIDGRETAITTPSALARKLQRSSLPSLVQQLFPGQILQLLKQAVDAVQDKVKVGDNEFTINGKAVSAILGALAGDSSQAMPLSDVIDAYTELLHLWEQARAKGAVLNSSPPVLVLDEANKLMTWGDEYKVERQALLDFFVTITKVRSRSHVVLATSEYAFQSWLSKEVGPTFFDTFVVGDFLEHEARRFLDQRLQQSHQDGVQDADWHSIYKVCGGNPGALLRAAGFFVTLGGWQPALSQVVKDVWGTMEAGYKSKPGAGYTAADYAAAVKAILDSPHQAVDAESVEAALCSQPGLARKVLEAMVQANLLALRPYSPWAKDIDPEAFGPEQDQTVVTAPTALHLHLMRRHKDKLLAALDNVKAQPGEGGSGVSPQQVGPTGSSYGDASEVSSRPPSPTSEKLAAVAREMADVKASVTAVEQQITSINQEVAQVRRDKAEGWQEELAYLRGKEQQLVRKEEQLREQLGRLQQEKLLLMKREDHE